MSQTVTVALGQRAYEIYVGTGLLAQAGGLLGTVGVKPGAVVPVVTDSHVAERHLAPLLEGLGRSGLEARTVVMAPGEASKSFAGLEKLAGALLEMEIDRQAVVLAFGGGVVGDLAGFAAGILKRGVDVVQIPTTLLAQVDSSVGGKTAINTVQGKNLLGLFHQPRLVIADTDLLKTLPRRELLSGYAEVVKYGALGDAAFFAWLQDHGAQALAGAQEPMIRAVAHSCRMKAEIVARDEREGGERALLNLGHTFGHALEAATGFSDRLLHGEAVAIGMALAFQLSVRLGFCPKEDCQRFIAHLTAVGLPSAIADIGPSPPPADELLRHMAHDKKVTQGRAVFVLLKAIGQAFLSDAVPPEAVKDVLSR